MTLQIGRIPAMPEPMDWQNTGDQATITARLGAGSVNAARILRDQLLGYAGNPDESVIPIVSTADDRLTGFYRITAVDVPTTLALLKPGGPGVLEYVLHAQRISGYRSAAIEAVINGALMVNANGIATGTAEPFHGFPASTIEYGLSVASTIEARPGVLYASGVLGSVAQDVDWVRMNPAYKALARLAMQPSKFYDGACYITHNSPTAHPVIGRQESPDGTSWSIENGLVYVSFPSSYFQLYWTDSTHTFRTSAQMLMKGSTASTGIMRPLSGYPGSAVRIIRNAPEEVRMRVPCYFDGSNGAAFSPAYFDITLRRGSRVVRIYLVTAATDTWLFGNAFAGVASTALTGGNVWTANDGFGNRVLIMTAQTRTDDLALGRFTMNTTRTTFDVGVSMELAGTASVNRDTAQSQIYQYHAAQSERMQVVGR